MDGDVDWVDDEPSAPWPRAVSGYPGAGATTDEQATDERYWTSPAYARHDVAAEDVLEFGPGRPSPPWLQRLSARIPHPRRLRWLTPALAAAVLAGYLVIAGEGPDNRRPAVAESPTVAADIADSTVLLIAKGHGPLADYVRPTADKGACVGAPVGSQPVERIGRRLTAVLTGFTPRAVGRILDQSTALCAVQLRATDRTGTVVVVQVTAPQHRSTLPFTTVRIGVTTVGRTTLCVVTALTPSGWSITVGSLGRPGDQPSSALLLDLAQDPRLLW